MKRKPRRRRAKESKAARAALACMMQAEENTPEYWDAFKKYAQEEAKAAGRESPRTVNGISVNDPDFTRLVLDSTKEQDPFYIKYETRRKSRGHHPGRADPRRPGGSGSRPERPGSSRPGLDRAEHALFVPEAPPTVKE